MRFTLRYNVKHGASDNSSKNQIVIPREAREALDLKSGDKVRWWCAAREFWCCRNQHLTGRLFGGWRGLAFQPGTFRRNVRVGRRGVEAITSAPPAHRSGHQRLLHQLEANAKYLSLTDAVFAWVERTGHGAVTSTVTMTELLVPSYRDNNEHRVDEFYGLLSNYPNLRWIAPDLEAADMAARLRATCKLRTPDALQASTAILAQATGFIKNGPIFLRVVEFETAVLDQFL